MASTINAGAKGWFPPNFNGYAKTDKNGNDDVGELLERWFNCLPFATIVINNTRVCLAVATFVQHLCARTPYDEIYVQYFRKKDGKPKYHYPDDYYTRYHWTFQVGNNPSFTSGEIHDAFPYSLFDVDDKGDITCIAEWLEKGVMKNNVIRLDDLAGNIRADNDSPYYDMLELGGYASDTPEKKGAHYSHGVIGGFTYHAPRGMYSLTIQELDSIIDGVRNKA